MLIYSDVWRQRKNASGNSMRTSSNSRRPVWPPAKLSRLTNESSSAAPVWLAPQAKAKHRQHRRGNRLPVRGEEQREEEFERRNSPSRKHEIARGLSRRAWRPQRSYEKWNMWRRERLALLAVVAAHAHAWSAFQALPLALRQRGGSSTPLAVSASARGDTERCSPPPQLSRRAFAASGLAVLATAGQVVSVAPVQAGTVMVGGEAVAADEDLDDEAIDALEGGAGGGGALDVLLAKVNLKKLGFWGATFLVADTVSGLVMGNSFLKIVRGKEDPDDWKTKVVDNFLGAQQNSVDLDSLKELTALVNDKVTSNTVMVFSKTNCPFCKNAKAALDAQGIAYEVMELDTRADGQDIQDIMLSMTGARSVPRVFVKGKFVGGGDDTCALAQSGQLKALLED